MTSKADAAGVLAALRETGACLDGHFQLSSGLHSDQYFQCALALSLPDRAEILARAVSSLWEDARIGAVVGPAIGGIVIAYEVARQVGVRALFTERHDGRMTLRRGFAVARGEPVLLCEDVITTGRSVGEALAVVRDAGARPVGLTAVVRRLTSEEGAEAPSESSLFGLPLRVPVTTRVRQWAPRDCPLCRDGVPLAKPGSRPQP